MSYQDPDSSLIYQHQNNDLQVIDDACGEIIATQIIHTIDPITRLEMKDPVKNTLCGHTYEKSSILQIIKKNPKTKCPMAGCPNKNHVTENHLILVNLKNSKDIDGARVENVCDKVQITLNKNSVPGDKSALNPGGMRLGAHALTSRGFKEAEFKRVVELVDKAVEIAKEAKAKTKTKTHAKSKLFSKQDDENCLPIHMAMSNGASDPVLKLLIQVSKRKVPERVMNLLILLKCAMYKRIVSMERI